MPAILFPTHCVTIHNSHITAHSLRLGCPCSWMGAHLLPDEHYASEECGAAAATYSENYRQVSNIRHTLLGNKTVDHSDVVGASPVGAAPTTSSFST